MTKSKKPSTVEGWEQVCNNLNSALQLSIETEAELIEAIEDFRKKNEDLNTTLIKSAGIIQYLERKLERTNSV
jgi:hypothetical protein